MSALRVNSGTRTGVQGTRREKTRLESRQANIGGGSENVLNQLQGRSMPDHCFDVDGARVLADLNALRAIGAYKTGVHRPTFSEPHMRSLEWLAQRLPG